MMYPVPWPLPPLCPIHYRMRSAGAQTWKPADDMVRSAYAWQQDYILSLDWIAAERLTDSQLTAGTEWQIETARGLAAYQSTRVEFLPLARIVCVTVRAA